MTATPASTLHDVHAFPLPLRIPGYPTYNGRKVYRALAETLGSRADGTLRESRKLANNTYLQTHSHGLTIRFHSTDVVTVSPAGIVTLKANGWTSVTTAKRINDFLLEYVYRPFGVRFHVGNVYRGTRLQRDHGWYLQRWNPTAVVTRRRARRGPDHVHIYSRHPWSPSLGTYDTSAEPVIYTYTTPGPILGYHRVQETGTFDLFPFFDGMRIHSSGRVDVYLPPKPRVYRTTPVPRPKPLARTLPNGEPRTFYKVLLDDPTLSAEFAGRAPYQTDYVWPIDTVCKVAGKLEPCANGIHFTTADFLRFWYHGDSGALPGARQVRASVWEFVPFGRVYDAREKCVARGGRVTRRLDEGYLRAILETPIPCDDDGQQS